MPDDLPFSNKLPSSHANRHAWALEKHGHLLAEALRNDTSAEARAVEKLTEGQISAHIVSLIMEKADPSQNKGMTAWLVGQYGQGKLRLEDLGTANETLTMFRRYAPRLEKNQRDLGQYPNLAAVWEAVIGFANEEEQHLSGKAQKALDRDKAYAESRILRQDPDGFTIAVPLTEFAAKWWGRGTRWCTAAEEDNKFWQYHQQAPLIVMVIPQLGLKGKFQLWSSNNDTVLMDATDTEVPKDVVAAKWAHFKDPILHAVWSNGLALRYLPAGVHTVELCSRAVAQNGEALKYVPETLRTEEMCRIAVAQDGLAFSDVPEKLRTDAMCKTAVAQNGSALAWTPNPLRTEEICRIAVTKNAWALEWVPEHLRTKELCMIAVENYGESLQHVPKHLRRVGVCRLAVSKASWAFRWVPRHIQTEGFYRGALEQNGMALSEVPEHLRTEELCKIAVTQNGKALAWVPKELRTENLCRIAIAQNGWSLTHVPEALRTDEMCRIAVSQNGRALAWVPEKFRTEEVCRLAVLQNGWALEHVPEVLRTEEMCRIAVAQNGVALEHVPWGLRTDKICRIAVAKDGCALYNVPRAMRDLMSAFIPPPVPAWDISLLEDLVRLLGTATTPAPSGLRHA
jgi:exosome complex RNA-binding protein Rrp4